MMIPTIHTDMAPEVKDIYPLTYCRDKVDLPIDIEYTNRGSRFVVGDIDYIAQTILNNTTLILSTDGKSAWVLNKDTNIWHYVSNNVREFLLYSVIYPQAQEFKNGDSDNKVGTFLGKVGDKVYELVKGNPQFKEGYFNDRTNDKYRYLGECAYFQNGALNMRTLELRPFEPWDYRTQDTILPIHVKETPVTPPEIEKNRLWQAVNFFTDSLSEKALCEFIGSCVYENKPEAVHAQIVVSRGTRNGGNGKSILMTKIIGSPLFGKMYTELPSNRAFNTKGEFNSALLVDKQLIFIDELNPYTLEPEVFKQQITATRIKVNEKGKAEYDARFGGHFAGASNDVFKVRDASDGSLRRILPIIFNKQVTKGDDKVTFMRQFNPDVSTEMRDTLNNEHEKAEFIRWCVQEYAELLKRREDVTADEFVWTLSDEAKEMREELVRSKTPVIDLAFNSGLFEYTGNEGDLVELKLFTDGILLANRYNTDDRSRITRKMVKEDMRDYMYNEGKRSRIKAICTNPKQHHADDLNTTASPRVYVSGFKLAHDDLDSDLEKNWFETIKKHLGKHTIMEEVFDVYLQPEEVF